jgi:hypothetical protein
MCLSRKQISCGGDTYYQKKKAERWIGQKQMLKKKNIEESKEREREKKSV